MRAKASAAIILLAALSFHPGAAMAQGRDCRGSRMSCEDLRYYCGMGDQTPDTVRRFCGADFEPRYEPRYQPRAEPRYDPRYGSNDQQQEQADRRYDPRYQAEADDDEPQDYEPPGQESQPPRWSYRELQYYCSLGSQTPRSMRRHCFRFGLWQR
jgi:hypothetical protein